MPIEARLAIAQLLTASEVAMARELRPLAAETAHNLLKSELRLHVRRRRPPWRHK